MARRPKAFPPFRLYRLYRRHFGLTSASQKLSATWDRLPRRTAAIPRHKNSPTHVHLVFLNQPWLLPRNFITGLREITSQRMIVLSSPPEANRRPSEDIASA
jgi:hypothetical protein